MHRYEVSKSVRKRVLDRMGRMTVSEAIDVVRTAFVVIDMQNYFCAEGFPAEVPMARSIVPNINRLAAALRNSGGTIVWVQTTSAGAIEYWRNYQTQMLSPKRQQERLAGLDELSVGFRLLSTLQAHPDDLWVKKIKYSAFIQGSSDIDAELRSQGIDTLLIGGTLTNVCCESSARDAMMLGYRVALVSDCNATLTDEEHRAALDTFMMFFGDVMDANAVIAKLRSE